MMLKMYSIFDIKSEIHQPPLFCHNTGHALRVFTDIVARPDTTLHLHPADFRIYEVGEFDDRTGELVPIKPHLVCSVLELVHDASTMKGNDEN